jgi:cell division protein FtsL
MERYQKGFWILLIANIVLLSTLIISIAASVKREGDIKILNTKIEEKDKQYNDIDNALISRNQELYNCRMEANEWKELFYSAIDFHPDESYPYK